MNAFLNTLEKHAIKKEILKRDKLTTLQVNLGNLCNQSCRHCHIEASPLGKDIMPRRIMEDIINFLACNKIRTLDITAGAPELNPDFDYFVKSARGLVEKLIVRSNLTVFFEPGKEYLPAFFKDYRVHLIGSLPCYTENNVDSQRGTGVFRKSIKALRLLNNAGFSKTAGLMLDLVYNPGGAYLPALQNELERDYKNNLHANYGITFNSLLTITNVAIKRFKKQLKENNEYEKYSSLLEKNFNPKTLQGLMCRVCLSVGFNGYLYDCDFNLSLGLSLKDAEGKNIIISKLKPSQLEKREILTGKHCFACAAGRGSSCQGALTGD